VKTALNSLAEKLGLARSAVQDLHQSDTEQRQAHEKLKAERTRLISAPPSRQELIRTAEGQIDAIARAVALELSPRLVSALAGRIDVEASGKINGHVPGNLFDALPALVDARVLIGLMPAVVKARVGEIIQAAKLEAGPPMADREQLLAELDVRIAEVEEQHTALCDQAAALGLTIPLLDDVRMRRAQAAHRAELAELHKPRPAKEFSA
jgi:hypothetical protein